MIKIIINGNHETDSLINKQPHTNPPKQAVATKIKEADGNISEAINTIQPGPEIKYFKRSLQRRNIKQYSRE